MKALSLRQASRCETAKTPKCKCRCGGKFHGAKRGAKPELPESWDRVLPALGLTREEAMAPGADFFEQLPANDPHHIDSAEAKKQKRRKRSSRTLYEAFTGEKPPSRQLPLIPPGLEQELMGPCAACGQDEWVHHAYWREAFIGADHEFQPKGGA